MDGNEQQKHLTRRAGACARSRVFLRCLHDFCIISVEPGHSIVLLTWSTGKLQQSPHIDLAIVRNRRAYLCLQLQGKHPD
jgi:hypothetical protein